MQNLVGHLIGRNGQFKNLIKIKAGANLKLTKPICSKRHKVCSLEGQQVEIEAALKMIRIKLPQKKYPSFSTERVYLTNNTEMMTSFEASNLHVSHE